MACRLITASHFSFFASWVHQKIARLNLQDALDLAVLIEKEAEDRYLLFADELGQRYSGDASAFFTMMARNEQRHENEITERSRLLFGDTASRVTKSMIKKDI
jgi:rubrerythrin